MIRELDRAADIETRYGGGFVQSIDGISGAVDGGRSFDWFFYVNGVESSIGSAEVQVGAGDRIWWDYRDWTDAMRVPAVVGSWPEPFAQASAGSDREPVRVECAGDRTPCDEAAERLSSAGVDVSIEPYEARAAAPPARPLRMLVGEWSRIRTDSTAGILDDGPASSGVFARFVRAEGEWRIEGLDAEADEAVTLGRGSGLVAALRFADDPPVWIATGTDTAGVDAAVGLLAEAELRDRYAVATDTEQPVALPVSLGDGG